MTQIQRDSILAPRGVTILEIILSIFIFGLCIGALSELSRNAFRNALDAKNMTQAELLAESILAKVRLGILEMEPVSEMPVTNQMNLNDTIEDTNVISGSEALWLYSLDVEQIDDYGLVELAVTVRQNISEENRPIACRLVRWLALETEETEETSTQ